MLRYESNGLTEHLSMTIPSYHSSDFDSILHFDWASTPRIKSTIASFERKNTELFRITKAVHLTGADIVCAYRWSWSGQRAHICKCWPNGAGSKGLYNLALWNGIRHTPPSGWCFFSMGCAFCSRSELIFVLFLFGSRNKRVAINYSMPNAFDNTRLINSRLSMKSYSKKKNFDFILGIYSASSQKSEIGSVHAILWHYFSSPPFHTFVHTKW